MKRGSNLPFTCKDCPDRYPGCHSGCRKYNREKEIWEKQKAAKMLERQADYYAAEMVEKHNNTGAIRRKQNRGRKYFCK